MRILYCPIIEPGANHAVAVANKRGLYAALVKAGHWVTQYDYLDRPDWENELQSLATIFQPDLLLTQFHGADGATIQMMRNLRDADPNMKAVNWSGDSWRHSLTSETMIELLRYFDVQLIAAPDVLPEYEQLGIRAGFWQIAYEAPVGELPGMPTYDIVFLGNVISPKRREMLEMLRTLPYKVGIYGDWHEADGYNCYDFGAGEALYKNAKLAIADNVYPDQVNYISNRPIQIMASGGAMCLHQHVDKMDELSHHWIHSMHYVEWHTLDDLRSQIDYWMQSERDRNRREIVRLAKVHVQQFHTYDARVEQLFEEYLK